MQNATHSDQSIPQEFDMNKYRRILHKNLRDRNNARKRVETFHKECICKVCGYTASTKISLLQHFLYNVKLGNKSHISQIKSSGFNIRLKRRISNYSGKLPLEQPFERSTSVYAITSAFESSRRKH